jgi:WD40 repeat protein
MKVIRYSPEGAFFSFDDKGNLCKWDLTKDSFAIVARSIQGYISDFEFSQDSQTIAISSWLNKKSELRIFDLRSGQSRIIQSHGYRVESVAFDQTGTRIITGDKDGVIRVGAVTGDTPALLLGHQSGVHDIAVSSDDQWILSIEEGHPIVKLWRMPKGREKPLQLLSANEFQNVIRKMTNVRIVADESQPTGYRTKLDPFTGWGKE